MDAQTADRNTREFPISKNLIAEGKTKLVYEVSGKPDLALIISKDDITAGDGAKHDIIPNKGQLATETTCNVFTLLKACGIPVAFVQRDNVNSFVAPVCNMLPYEVVVRGEAHGSYLERRPDLRKGHRFPKPVTELFLKTKGRRWGAHALVCDDPLMVYSPSARNIHLYDAHAPIYDQIPFLMIPETEVFSQEDEQKYLSEMQDIALRAFQILKRAWRREGMKIVDYKVEFGIGPDGTLLLADVIDNDSWRVLKDGAYIDKQLYRDGGSLSDVAATYHRVADATSRFRPW